MKNIHATLVSFKNCGVLLTGSSGAGKSDLALRMIMGYDAQLVADDRVEIENKNNILIGKSPDILRGLLEIRGIGLRKFTARDSQKIDLIIELSTDRMVVNRYPEDEYETILGVTLKKIKLYPFDCSVIHKIIIALDDITNRHYSTDNSKQGS